MFVDRARGISPHFSITSENASAIIESCRRLDGIPLALELASARLNILTPQQITARLDSRFNLLNLRQSTGAVTHHQTLRAAIDWSHDLLNADERTFLRHLAIFDASFSLDAAEGICTEEEFTTDRILDLLASLVDKSLVLAETTGRAEARYRLLETIHEYALEKLKEAGEFERLRNRHLDFFVVRTEEIISKLQSSSYPSLWLNWLNSELDNIRSALEWALENGHIESGLRLVITLFDFWINHGSISESRNWHERLLAQADEQIPIMLRARAAFNAGMTAGFMGDATGARAHERAAVALCEAAGEEGVKLLARAQAPIVVAAIMDRDFVTAYNTIERTVALSRGIDDDMQLLLSLGTQAIVAIGLGRYQMARSLAEESLKAAHQSGNLYAALMVSYLGYIEHCEQNYERAQALYEEALTVLREQGATREEPRVLQSLAHTRLQRGDLDQAYTLICESVAQYRSQGELKAMGECLISFGVLASERSMQTEAVRLLTTGATYGRSIYVSLLLADGREYERYLAAARAKLTEQEFERAQQEGRAQTLEQGIEYALSLPLGPAGSVSKEQDEFGGLTEREREIVSLIGQGKSNGEIAVELVLSKRTVEKHVANILSKLELTSRTQMVRWAMEHHLTSTSS